jgi:hypothetical protein
LDRRLGGPQGRSGPSREENSDPSVDQPVASRYTDCAILARRVKCPEENCTYIRDELLDHIMDVIALEKERQDALAEQHAMS